MCGRRILELAARRHRAQLGERDLLDLDLLVASLRRTWPSSAQVARHHDVNRRLLIPLLP
jgi:hypothetical protein